MIHPPITYSQQHAERRYLADRLARDLGLKPSVADWWLWIRWCIANRQWDSYHVAPGRAIVWQNQELESGE